MTAVRQCAKPGCGSPATAVLTFHYLNRTAWIDDLVGEIAPPSHPLCAHHAGALRVPRGWTKHDRRWPVRMDYLAAVAV
jgi:hypothetical protein